MAEVEKKTRIPPNSKESEMMVLGCMLTNINALNVSADSLQDTDFYYTEHQIIYSSLKAAYRADKPADIHLIGEDLKRQNKLDAVGGISYLTTLAQYAGTSAFIEEYIELVREKAILRRMISTAQGIEKVALEEPPDVLAALDQAQAQLFQISQENQKQGGVSIKDLITGLKAETKLPYLKELQERQEKFLEKGPGEPGITGMPTHFADIDKMLNGFNPSNFMILAARPSMGKCVVGETPILDPETGKLTPIKDLVQNRSGAIVTLGADWTLKKAIPSAFVADGVKPTFKMRTALGKEIEATAVHPLLTIAGWKPLAELKVGDRIAVPRKLPFFGKKQWPEHHLKMLSYLIADGNLTNLQPRFTNNNPKIVADFKNAALAFGNVTITEDLRPNRTPTFSIALDRTAQNTLLKKFSQSFKTLSDLKKQVAYQIAKNLGYSKYLVYRWAYGYSTPCYAAAIQLEEALPELPQLSEVVRTNPVTDFIKNLGLMGKNSHQKFLPEEIFELTKENLALFINRLFSCDGTAYVAICGDRPFPVIAYSSVSATLIHQLQHLLLRFGIISKIRKKETTCNDKDFDSFELEIHGKEDLIRFCQEIGIHGKEDAVNLVLQQALIPTSGWTKDSLPIEIWDLIRIKKGERSWGSLFRAKGLTSPSNLHDGKRAIRRDTLAKIAHVLDDEELMQIAKSDVYWDRITEITPTGEKEVFDLSINQTHNFIAADIVVHNTAVAINLAENICFRNHVPVGFFSLEMSATQILHRIISSQSEVESEKILTGSLSGAEYQRIVGTVNRMQKDVMIIDDQPGLKITDIRARARRMKEAYNVGFIVIDYLQLITGSGSSRNMENRQTEISEISRMLKTLARELNIPILCLAQLSRKVEERQGHRPMMSDLRESGCLSGDTLIKDANTGSLYTIKELAERENPTPIQVFAMDQDLKIKPHTMTKVFYSGKKKVFKLQTKSGRTIKASANHPFYKLEGWTRLDEIKVGDRIAIPRSLNTTPPPSPLDKNELMLLSHLLGDGCILPKQPYHYTSADPENLNTVTECSKQLFGIETRLVQQKNWHHVYLPSPFRLTHGVHHPITNWFQKLGIERVRSYEKKIPTALFSCQEEDRLLFLKHLWATDGNISSKLIKGHKPACSIYYASSSVELATQVQHLLLSSGIQSSLRTSKKQGYRLMHNVYVEGSSNQKLFLSRVGCAGQRGKNIPQFLESLNQIEPNPNNDAIPKAAWDLFVKPAKDKANLSWRDVCQKLNTSYSGTALLKSGISRKRLSALSHITNDRSLELLAESDVFWDEIASITELGVEDVYDATVPGVHNFVANDLIVHNSLEQDADVVMMLFRRDYYDKYDKPGLAEVIVAKNRHGPVGDVQLTFRKDIGQFANYSPIHAQGDVAKGNKEAFSAFSPDEG
jgi:replicative DNA helicase